MSKVHYADFEEPLDLTEWWRRGMYGNCGAAIEWPEIVCMWDEQGMGKPVEVNSLRDCRKCIEAGFQHRYVYGIRERTTDDVQSV